MADLRVAVIIRSQSMVFKIDAQDVAEVARTIQKHGKVCLPTGVETNDLGAYYETLYHWAKSNKQEVMSMIEASPIGIDVDVDLIKACITIS